MNDLILHEFLSYTCYFSQNLTNNLRGWRGGGIKSFYSSVLDPYMIDKLSTEIDTDSALFWSYRGSFRDT
jgi:hypothetical protein